MKIRLLWSVIVPFTISSFFLSGCILNTTNDQLTKANQSLEKTVAEFEETNSQLKGMNTELEKDRALLSLMVQELEKDRKLFIAFLEVFQKIQTDSNQVAQALVAIKNKSLPLMEKMDTLMNQLSKKARDSLSTPEEKVIPTDIKDILGDDYNKPPAKEEDNNE